MNTIQKWILKDFCGLEGVLTPYSFNEYDPEVDTERSLLRSAAQVVRGFNEYDPEVDTERFALSYHNLRPKRFNEYDPEVDTERQG